MSGQETVMLMNENFSPCTVGNKNYTALYVGQHREVEVIHKA